MFINGENRILYIKINGEFLPIGCLTGDSFSETVEMLNTTTGGNAGWETSTPTTQSYNISFEGLVINTTLITVGDTTKVSYDRLKELKRNRTLIEWKSEDIDKTFVESGKGYITELSDSSSIDEFISFNASIVGFGKLDENSFVTTWKTTTNNETIVIGLDSSKTYDFRVDWGDYTSQIVTGNSNLSHTYSVPGDYLVKINGIFPRIIMSASGTTPNNIISLNNWGAIQWESMNSAFKNCINLYICNTQDTPDLSNVTSLISMFENAGSNTSNLFINNINKWDTKNITQISSMFKDATSFNQNINAWDVSNVTSMNNIFNNATSFAQPLNNWDVSNVLNMYAVFKKASSFNQDIGAWNVSNVTTMFQMFTSATSFNKDIGAWDVSNVTNMQRMFSEASSFNKDIGAWDVSNVTTMKSMLKTTPFNQDISEWDVRNVSDFNNFMSNSFALNPTNYSALLIQWATLPPQSNITVSFGDAKYNIDAYSARNTLSTTYNWTITDGGPT